MISQLSSGLAVAGLLVPGALAQSCISATPKVEPVVADGYEARVILNGLKNPRHLVFDGEGNLLVAQQGGVGINRVVLEESADGEVCATSSEVLISDAAVRNRRTIFHTSQTPKRGVQMTNIYLPREAEPRHRAHA